ncbi:MAG TPA: hypothetical protein VIY68_07680 [Steroidobacteraceae bacterium]
MTRAEQIKAALTIINPAAHELHRCSEHVEWSLNVVEGAGRAAQHAGITQKEMRAKRAALERLQHVSSGTRAAIALPRHFEDAIVFQIDWLDHWSPPSPWVKQEYAVAMAYDLLSSWNPAAITVSATGKWNSLAAALIGDPDVNLFRQLRKFDRGPRRNQPDQSGPPNQPDQSSPPDQPNQSSPPSAGTKDADGDDDPLLKQLRHVHRYGSGKTER